MQSCTYAPSHSLQKQLPFYLTYFSLSRKWFKLRHLGQAVIDEYVLRKAILLSVHYTANYLFQYQELYLLTVDGARELLEEGPMGGLHLLT